MAEVENRGDSFQSDSLARDQISSSSMDYMSHSSKSSIEVPIFSPKNESNTTKSPQSRRNKFISTMRQFTCLYLLLAILLTSGITTGIILAVNRNSDSQAITNIDELPIDAIIPIKNPSQPPPPPAIIGSPSQTMEVIRINSGSENSAEVNGIIYLQDMNYTLMGTQLKSIPLSEAVVLFAEAGTWNMLELLRTEHVFTDPGTGYEILVPYKGLYKVVLGFSEFFFTEKGQRVFSVKAEDDLLLEDFDILDASRNNLTGAPLVGGIVRREFNVIVIDGVLNLRFYSKIDSAKLSFLEVYRFTDVDLKLPSESQNFLYSIDCGSDTGGFSENINWSPDSESLLSSPEPSISSSSSLAPGYLQLNVLKFPHLFTERLFPISGSGYQLSLEISDEIQNSLRGYLVKLFFVESYFESEGKRVFSVDIEGNRILSGLDIWKETQQKGGVFIKEVWVGKLAVSRDQLLNINFYPTKDQATISAIQVIMKLEQN